MLYGESILGHMFPGIGFLFVFSEMIYDTMKEKCEGKVSEKKCQDRNCRCGFDCADDGCRSFD